MGMKKILFLFISLGLFNVLLAQEVQEGLPSLDSELSLDDCIQIAMANSPRMQKAQLAVQSAEISVSNAKNAFLPTASAKASGGASSSKYGSGSRINNENLYSQAEADLTISGITDLGRNIRIQNLGLDQSKLDRCDVENSIVFSVKSAYYSLLAAQKAVAIRTQSHELYQDQYNRTKAFYDQGLRPKVDVTTAEVDLNNAALSLIRAKNLVKTRNAALGNVMGVTYQEEFKLKSEIELEEAPSSFEEVLTKAYANRPDVLSSKKALQIQEVRLAQAKAAYWPTFVLGASYTRNGDDLRLNTEDIRLSAGIEVPIFNSFKTYNGVKQAKINLESAKNSDRSLTNDIYLEVQNAFVKLNEAAESIPLAVSNVEKAKENMELAQGRYNEGIGDIISLKDAQVSYTDSELGLLTARYDYAVALAELKQAMGTK